MIKRASMPDEEYLWVREKRYCRCMDVERCSILSDVGPYDKLGFDAEDPALKRHSEAGFEASWKPVSVF